MNVQQLTRDDAVYVVDVQNDFCPGGRLAVDEGDAVVPILNRWIQAAGAAEALVVMSRDWHPPGHASFKPSGGPWPEHCVQHTHGADVHPDLIIPELVLLVSKGQTPDRDQYSGFDRTDLADELCRRGIRRIWIGGLAQDVCVRATALDARKSGFETHLLLDATRPVDAEQGESALREMREAGVIIED